MHTYIHYIIYICNKYINLYVYIFYKLMYLFICVYYILIYSSFARHLLEKDGTVFHWNCFALLLSFCQYHRQSQTWFEDGDTRVGLSGRFAKKLPSCSVNWNSKPKLYMVSKKWDTVIKKILNSFRYPILGLEQNVNEQEIRIG